MSKILPLIGSILWVLVVLLRATGAATEADGLEQALTALKIPTTVSPVEIVMTAPVAWGIYLWARKQWRAWRGQPQPLHPPVLKTEADLDAFIRRYQQLRAKGVPFARARREALQGVLVTQPVPRRPRLSDDAGTEG